MTSTPSRIRHSTTASEPFISRPISALGNDAAGEVMSFFIAVILRKSWVAKAIGRLIGKLWDYRSIQTIDPGFEDDSRLGPSVYAGISGVTVIRSITEQSASIE